MEVLADRGTEQVTEHPVHQCLDRGASLRLLRARDKLAVLSEQRCVGAEVLPVEHAGVVDEQPVDLLPVLEPAQARIDAIIGRHSTGGHRAGRHGHLASGAGRTGCCPVRQPVGGHVQGPVRDIGVGDAPLEPPPAVLANIGVVVVAEQPHHRRVPLAAPHPGPGHRPGRRVTVELDLGLGQEMPGRLAGGAAAGQALLQHRGDASGRLAVSGPPQPLAIFGEEPPVRDKVPGVEVATVLLDELPDLLPVLEPPEPRFDSVAWLWHPLTSFP